MATKTHPSWTQHRLERAARWTVAGGAMLLPVTPMSQAPEARAVSLGGVIDEHTKIHGAVRLMEGELREFPGAPERRCAAAGHTSGGTANDVLGPSPLGQSPSEWRVVLSDERQERAAFTEAEHIASQSMYLLATLQVGGDGPTGEWVGEPTAASFPAEFVLDYVRVWDRAGQ